MGVEFGVINKSGAWFSYGDMRLGQGRENVKVYLQQNPELSDEIEAKIREAEKNPPAKPVKPSKTAPKSAASAKARLDVTVEDDDD